MRRGMIGAACLLCLTTAASAARVAAIDVYRSSRISSEAARARFGRQIRRFAELRHRGDRASQAEARRLKAEVEAGLKGMAPLAYADLYYAEYATSARRSAYVTLDVVDAKDAAARMPFRRAPRGRAADPGGLLAAWRAFDSLGQTLLAGGRIDVEDRPRCLGFYCLWGESTPELASYEKRFYADAGLNGSALLRVLASDASGRQRADALYVLSYLQDGDVVTRIMLDALADPSPEVRTAALRVLSDIATDHKGVFIDASRLVSALDYPTSPDRAGALGVLVGLADNKTYRPYVISHAAVPAARLLRLAQPSSQDLAFTLLSMLADTPLDRADYRAWDQWAQSHSAQAHGP